MRDARGSAGSFGELASTHAEEYLPRSTPEAQGVSAEGILRFISSVRSAHELHGVMLMRHGCVIAEACSAPYRSDSIRLLNSLSKSVTSTAVGFAVTEGQLAVSDRVIDFFPRQVPAKISANLRALTVEHLLTMSDGQPGYPTDEVVKTRDWVEAYLAWPIEHSPGTVFSYNNVATYMLSAIVQEVYGQPLIDYLEPRLFAPLGIRNAHWESCPRGINLGGWGLSLTSESLAKFGQLYLQRGEWNGRQILPRQWIDTATSFLQDTSSWDVVSREGESREQAIERLQISSDCHQGYGYQFWRCRHGAYRGDGAFGQFCVVIPESDVVIVITSHTSDMQGMLDKIWEHLLPAIHRTPLSPSPSSARLQRELSSMAIPAPQSPIRSHACAARTFSLQSNSLGATRVSFDFGSDSCAVTLNFAADTAHIDCGIGRWIDNTVDMPCAPPKFITQGKRRMLRVAAAAFWTDAHTLKMHWRYCETPNYDEVICRFDCNAVTIEFMSDVVQLSKGKMSDDRPKLLGTHLKVK